MLNQRTDDEVLLKSDASSESSTDVGSVGSLPEQLYVYGGIFKHYVILTVERTEEGQFLLTDELFGSAYGVGDNIEEAVEDYTSMLLDYFHELDESRDHLSDHLSRQLLMLKSCILPLD